MSAQAASPYAYTPAAQRNRRAKADQLVTALRDLGWTSLPDDPDARAQVRRHAGLPRDPSVLTWALVDMLITAPEPEPAAEAFDQDVDDDVEPDR